jgi:DNA-binding IclR family transcriptional regulator
MRKAPKGIQSIDVGFRLLKALELAGMPLPLKKLAAAGGMTSAKAYPYLVSFVRTGVVRQDLVTGYYGLGPFATQLGLSTLGQLNVIDLAREEFAKLRQATGCGAYVSVWGTRGPTIVAKMDGIYQGSLGIQVGHVLPLLTSATGRVFLAFLDPLETRELATAEWRSQVAARPHRRRRSIADIVEAVRRDGFAEASRPIGRREGFVGSLRQVNPPFGAFSCPIFDPLGQLSAALSILVPIEIQVEKGRAQFLPTLQRAVVRISQKMGVKGAWKAMPPNFVAARATGARPRPRSSRR